MTGPAVDWQKVYQEDRLKSIASMTPPDAGAINAIQQRGVFPSSTTANPNGPAQVGLVSQGAGNEALNANPQLMGRAQFWGIPREVAAAMPMDQLEAMLQQYEAEGHQAAAQAGGWSQLGTMLAALPAMFGTDAAKSIIETPRNLPIVGEYFRKSQTLSEAVAKMSELEEGVRSATRSDFQWVNSTLGFGGSVAALWVPGNAAWKAAAIAGRAPAVIGIASPIARMAAQGGAAAWLLEGGSEHSTQAIAAGAVLGAAAHPVEQALTRFGPSIAAATDRISRYFAEGPWSRFVKPMPTPEEAVADAVGRAGQVAPAV
jgi:hypothetical protein